MSLEKEEELKQEEELRRSMLDHQQELESAAALAQP